MTSWGLARRIEESYARQLMRLTQYIAPRLEGVDSPDEIIRILKAVSKSPEFHAYSVALAQRMAGEVNKGVNQNWRRAAALATHEKGQVIRQALLRELNSTGRGRVIEDIITRNAALISSIPDQFGREIAAEMARDGMLTGIRATEVAGRIKAKFPDLTKSRARLIARTEVSKAQTALTQARAQDLGLNWYTWRTSEDERVRPSHQLMEGVLVNWNDPPNPEALARAAGVYDGPDYGNYHAGNIFNCRCYPEPVISFDDIDFPADIHFNGQFRHVGRREFMSGFALI